MPEKGSVLVGKKPLMNYVIACLTLFHSGAKEVSIKARGRAISRAVDVAEVVRRSFMSNVKVKEIKLGTEEMTRENRKVNVSTIEIVLST